MVLIFSSRELEYTTNQVIDWLDHYNVDYHRINSEDITISNSLCIDSKGVSVNFVESLTKGPHVAWFRRFKGVNLSDTILNAVGGYQNRISLVDTLKRDESVFVSSFIARLPIQYWLNNPANSSVNKIEVLKLASELGINIPETLITTKKQDLIGFIKTHDNIIVKSVGETCVLSDQDFFYSFLTTCITKETLKEVPDQFQISCFQRNIEKRYEIRTFFIDGEFYSMAIFSQKNNRTQNDFRNYDYAKPNRTVPYLLDEAICKKLRVLMKALALNSGSIDLIYGTDNVYYFLEVNPLGQFGMVSTPCNYQLEKLVAEHLIKKHNEAR